MSDTDHIAPEDEGRALAAEYVLGVLSAEERRAVETRMAEEASFAREVADWEERLGGIASYVPPVTPPAQSWLRIEAALGGPPLAADPRTIPTASTWQSLAFWRGLGIASSALAAACVAALIYVGMRPTPQAPPRTPLLATLTGLKTKQPNFVAAIGADGQSLMIVPAALLTTDKRSMELWLIPQGGKPASLGLIAAGQPVRLNVPAELLQHVGTGATLAVSLEPPGGSPTGQPTGEVIAHGDLSRL
jgi:anti-sigma-K factor RskA